MDRQNFISRRGKIKLLTYKQMKKLNIKDKIVYLNCLLGINYPDDAVYSRVEELNYLVREDDILK